MNSMVTAGRALPFLLFSGASVKSLVYSTLSNFHTLHRRLTGLLSVYPTFILRSQLAVH